MPNVDVHIRILPTSESVWRAGPNTITARGRSESFQATHVHNTSATNRDVFHTVSPMVAQVSHGINVTVLAYGQTGSGKTHTMVGSGTDGVFFLAAHMLTKEASSGRGAVRASYIEIYNEGVRDLLAPNSKEIEVRENGGRDVVLDGKTAITFTTVDELHNIITRGENTRSVAVTNLNNRSSRSHTILTLEIIRRDGTRVSGQLNLVDLAGSESASRALTGGTQLREGGFINKSLLALGNVVDAIVDNRPHVPYRESKLTRILQTSLGGNARTAFICCINPEPQNFDQTLSVLRFAQRAQKIRLNPTYQTTQPPQAIVELVDNYKAMCKEAETVIPQLVESQSRKVFPALLRAVEDCNNRIIYQYVQKINDNVNRYEAVRREAVSRINKEAEAVRSEVSDILSEVRRVNEMHEKEFESKQGVVNKVESETSCHQAELRALEEVREAIAAQRALYAQYRKELAREKESEINQEKDAKKQLADAYAEAADALHRSEAAKEKLRRQRSEHQQYRERQADLRDKIEVLDCELAELEHDTLQKQAMHRRRSAVRSRLHQADETIEKLTAEAAAAAQTAADLKARLESIQATKRIEGATSSTGFRVDVAGAVRGRDDGECEMPLTGRGVAAKSSSRGRSEEENQPAKRRASSPAKRHSGGCDDGDVTCGMGELSMVLDMEPVRPKARRRVK
eukprot:PhM_4_TR1943/c0_g2_i1/m.91883/K10396/KIF5; kinesin family member 5